MTNKLDITFEITNEELVTESNLHEVEDVVLYSIGHNLLSFYSFLQVADSESVKKVVDIINNKMREHKKGLN